jgi:hypothetical protein
MAMRHKMIVATVLVAGVIGLVGVAIAQNPGTSAPPPTPTP